MEPFIFRVRDCYYIRASYPSPAEHRHFAAHLVFAMERPFTALVDGKSVETVGIAIGSDVPHTILSVDPVLVVFIDELTPMSRCVKHTLLQGAPWRALEAAAYMKSAPALEQLTIRNVARAVHLSPSRLTHLFRRDTGISPSLYLANLKLERAFYLLDTGRSLTQVCMDAGFATPSHMADTSRKLYGMSMTEVKQIFLTGLGQNSR